MSRAGRKRKLGNRHPNGQVHREYKDSPKMIAALMPHRRGLDQETQIDQRAESELGRMRLRGQIGENQYLAGQRFSRVMGAYLATISPPRALAGQGKGFDCPGLPDCPDCICARRRASYESAHNAVLEAGRPALRALKIVVVENHTCPWELQRNFRWALSALSNHFGIGRT